MTASQNKTATTYSISNGAKFARDTQSAKSCPDRYGILTPLHLKALTRFVRCRVKSDEEADDIVQDTLLLACRHIEQFRYESSVGTWLSAIAINVMKGRWRRQASTWTIFVDSATLDWLEVRDMGQSPLIEAEQNQINNRLHGAISALPSQYRTVVELRDFLGLTLEETAARLTSSVPAIKSRHYRAKRMLFDRLSETHPKACRCLPRTDAVASMSAAA